MSKRQQKKATKIVTNTAYHRWSWPHKMDVFVRAGRAHVIAVAFHPFCEVRRCPVPNAALSEAPTRRRPPRSSVRLLAACLKPEQRARAVEQAARRGGGGGEV